MEKLQSALKHLSIILGLLSTFFILFSIISELYIDFEVDFVTSIKNIYNVIGRYSSLYTFTFIVCAFWATLKQLQISQANNLATLTQLKFVQEDIITRRNKDTVNETLKECNFYLRELQLTFKELSENMIPINFPIEWNELSQISNESLKKNYPTIFLQLESLNFATKNKLLLALYQIESFSSLFIHGNLDKGLARNIIGIAYRQQVGMMIGILAYFRRSEDAIFGVNIIELYNKWSK